MISLYEHSRNRKGLVASKLNQNWCVMRKVLNSINDQENRRRKKIRVYMNAVDVIFGCYNNDITVAERVDRSIIKIGKKDSHRFKLSPINFNCPYIYDSFLRFVSQMTKMTNPWCRHANIIVPICVLYDCGASQHSNTNSYDSIEKFK